MRAALASSHAYVNPAVALALGATLGSERFTRADVVGLALRALLAPAKDMAPIPPIFLGARGGSP